MSDLPIACTLTPDGMRARVALIDALASEMFFAPEPV